MDLQTGVSDLPAACRMPIMPQILIHSIVVIMQIE
jgi:hypothetical protein